MQFTERDVDGVRTAIRGLGAGNVYALAMALSDGVIQLEIFKRVDDNLQAIALSGHPYYTRSWEDVNKFLDSTFEQCPENAVRISDLAGFNRTKLLTYL